MKYRSARRLAGILLAFCLLLSGCQLTELPGTPQSKAAIPGAEVTLSAMPVPVGVGAHLDEAPVIPPPEPEPEEEPLPEEPELPEIPEEPEAPEETPLFPDHLRIMAGQAFAYDLTEGKMLAMKGEGESLYPASTTKLLTILLAQRYLDLEMLVTPGSEQTLILPNSSIACVDIYDTVTVEQLIEGMLLPSGNDAAHALAAAVGRAVTGEWNLGGIEAVEICVEAMNQYAQELGMVSTHFANVDGYLDSEHYTTVEDMAIVSVLAAQDEVIRKYCGLVMDTVTYPSGDQVTWYNSNLMLYSGNQWYNPHVTGMKTGSLLSHYSLVCTVEIGNKTYVTGVFTAPSTEDRYYDMNTIIKWLETIHEDTAAAEEVVANQTEGETP